ncbi:MAG: peptidyl-alpha-hydroxyglycine alpha-amidating lyase family protein [Candidatus Acidiferrales bacterium]
MMKRFALVLLLCLVAPLLASAQQQSVPEIPYDSVPNLLKLPADLYLGEAAGVAVNSKGHVFVFTRSGHTQLFEFDPNGKFVREIGKDLYGFSFAHVVRVDKDDNIWCVDEAANMVMEFNPAGRVVMLFGRKPEAVEGAAAPPGTTPPPPPPAFRTFAERLFNRPTDVAWDDAGNSFISDGYGNSRVVKYDKDGKWVKAWGKRGTEPGEFHTLHSIATDAKGNVYVGDRENNRIQVFDNDGNFLKQWTNIGAPWAICITPGPKQVLYTSDSNPGRIYKMDLDGNILGALGKAGKLLGQFGWVHEIACPSENTLYVAELLNWRVQKLILHPK